MEVKYIDARNRERVNFTVTVNVPQTKTVALIERSIFMEKGWFWSVTMPNGELINGHNFQRHEAEENIIKLMKLLYPDQDVTVAEQEY